MPVKAIRAVAAAAALAVLASSCGTEPAVEQQPAATDASGFAEPADPEGDAGTGPTAGARAALAAAAEARVARDAPGGSYEFQNPCVGRAIASSVTGERVVEAAAQLVAEPGYPTVVLTAEETAAFAAAARRCINWADAVATVFFADYEPPLPQCVAEPDDEPRFVQAAAAWLAAFDADESTVWLTVLYGDDCARQVLAGHYSAVIGVADGGSQAAQCMAQHALDALNAASAAGADDDSAYEMVAAAEGEAVALCLTAAEADEYWSSELALTELPLTELPPEQTEQPLTELPPEQTRQPMREEEPSDGGPFYYEMRDLVEERILSNPLLTATDIPLLTATGDEVQCIVAAVMWGVTEQRAEQIVPLLRGTDPGIPAEAFTPDETLDILRSVSGCVESLPAAAPDILAAEAAFGAEDMPLCLWYTAQRLIVFGEQGCSSAVVLVIGMQYAKVAPESINCFISNYTAEAESAESGGAPPPDAWDIALECLTDTDIEAMFLLLPEVLNPWW